jgi:hypothetical protein
MLACSGDTQRTIGTGEQAEGELWMGVKMVDLHFVRHLVTRATDAANPRIYR